MIQAGSVTFIAGPSLIIVVVVLVVLGIYQAVTRGRDAEAATTAVAQIRRCPECGEVVGRTAASCRHCKVELSGSAPDHG